MKHHLIISLSENKIKSNILFSDRIWSVSYTHLDVYKRQLQNRAGQRERTTGQVQSGFGKKTPVQKAKQQHESGGKGKNRGRPGTGGKKAE